MTPETPPPPIVSAKTSRVFTELKGFREWGPLVQIKVPSRSVGVPRRRARSLYFTVRRGSLKQLLLCDVPLLHLLVLTGKSLPPRLKVFTDTIRSTEFRKEKEGWTPGGLVPEDSCRWRGLSRYTRCQKCQSFDASGRRRPRQKE